MPSKPTSIALAIWKGIKLSSNSMGRPPCGVASGGEQSKRSKAFLLRHYFLLNHNLQMRGHILVQLHRHGELAQSLQRFVELDLLAIQGDSLLHNGVGNVTRSDRA